MLSFPLSTLLIPYAIFLSIYIAFSLIHISHLGKFGASSIVAFFLVFTFLAGTAIIAYWSWNLLAPIDWKNILTVTLPNLNSIPVIE